MTTLRCDVLIVGGGTGGCAAAMAAVQQGVSVVLTEEFAWLGGQLTSQIVPPDEHPWIESFGCTASYRAYREGVRRYYRDHTPLSGEERANPRLNPGGGWVSRLCHEPRIGRAVLDEMLYPGFASGSLTVLQPYAPISADVEGDFVRSVLFVHLETGEQIVVEASQIVDATELGDLLPITGTDYVMGAESKSEFGEPHGVDGPPEPDNLQGITWCFALAHDEGSHRNIDKPENYEFWKGYTPKFWPGPILGFEVVHAHTMEKRELPLFRDDHWYALFPYRQIIDPSKFAAGTHPHPVTVVNWPQNDYYLSSPLSVDEPRCGATRNDLLPFKLECYRRSRELSWCLLYWLQHEAPRHDGGVGYPGLYLRPDVTGTADGFAQAPYIREGRRIKALWTVTENHVSAAVHPGRARAEPIDDSVGVGAYRIDLHPATNGTTTIDLDSLPFQIPLRSLIPRNRTNLLAGCKNLGVTHIANGCYRLHPVEWNIGEAAGAFAAFCHRRGVTLHQVAESKEMLSEFQALLVRMGFELDWPALRVL